MQGILQNEISIKFKSTRLWALCFVCNFPLYTYVSYITTNQKLRHLSCSQFRIIRMARYLLLFLILVDGFLGVAMADTSTRLAPSPSIHGISYNAEAPKARKLGRHQAVTTSSSPPLLAPQPRTILQPVEESSNGSPPPSVDESGQGQEVHLEMHHGSLDKSIAGGGVILGLLATTFLVALFCYIRATRRHKLEAKGACSEISN